MSGWPHLPTCGSPPTPFARQLIRFMVSQHRRTRPWDSLSETTWGMRRSLRPWAERQARLLRHCLIGQADLDNIAEELDGLSRSEPGELRSCLTLIILHVLKLTYQPERASRSWTNTVHRERRNLERLLHDSPSFDSHLVALFEEAF